MSLSRVDVSIFLCGVGVSSGVAQEALSMGSCGSLLDAGGHER